MKKLSHLFLLVFLGTIATNTIYAQTKIEANAYFLTAEEESIEVAGQTIGVRVEITGILQVEDSSSPFHLSSVTCRGTAIHKSIFMGGPSCLVCDIVDQDGDAFLLEQKGEELKEINIIGGTGKYKNISGSGSASVVKEVGWDKLVQKWVISVGM